MILVLVWVLVWGLQTRVRYRSKAVLLGLSGEQLLFEYHRVLCIRAVAALRLRKHCRLHSIESQLGIYASASAWLLKVVFRQNSAYLSDLVRLRMCAVALQVYHLCNAFFPEYMMTSSYSLMETEPPQKCAQVIETYVGIGSTLDYLLLESSMSAQILVS